MTWKSISTPAHLIRRALLLVLFTCLGSALACHGATDGDHGHGHGHGHGEEGDDGPEPVALTLWTATHELFVEFEPLVSGKPSGYHAHVTRLADNYAATTGRFSVRFLQGGQSVAEITAAKVARRGIFIPKGASPKRGGVYRLVFRYESGKELASWDAGEVTIGSKPAEQKEQPEGSITFLKEQQWQIPFSTALSKKEALARELILPVMVQADPALVQTVTAPSRGVVFWAGERGPTVIGMNVRRGQVIGRLLPAAAPDHWSTLQLQMQRARIERAHTKSTLARLEQLAKDGLVPKRRVSDTRAVMNRAEAALKAARQKVGQLRGRRSVSLPLIAPSDGTLVEIHITDGHQAKAGMVLAHVATAETVLARAAVFSLDLSRISHIRQARLRRQGHPRPMFLTSANSTLLTEQVVVDPDTLSAPVVYRVKNSSGALRTGEMGELVLSVGKLESHLTVPTEAVVEINTRPFLFVMRSGESFDRLRVRLGPSNGKRVAIRKGLNAADRVVTAGAFDVYAASLAGAVESHRH
jgi:cobalt-zinc-cadmium efflux system membrane fusion protein